MTDIARTRSLTGDSKNYWLFPKLKSPLKGKRFHAIDKVQENMTGQLMAIPTKDFAECFEQLKDAGRTV